ncbi:MAG: response regulator [Planctomycetota bacterium]
MIRRHLGDVGLDVRACDNSKQCQALAIGASAVLADIHLPNVDSIDIVMNLRENGYGGPIVMVSGDRSRETIGKTIIAGASDYLTKPFDKSQLIAKIRKHTGLPLASLNH